MFCEGGNSVMNSNYIILFSLISRFFSLSKNHTAHTQNTHKKNVDLPWFIKHAQISQPAISSMGLKRVLLHKRRFQVVLFFIYFFNRKALIFYSWVFVSLQVRGILRGVHELQKGSADTNTSLTREWFLNLFQYLHFFEVFLFI